MQIITVHTHFLKERKYRVVYKFIYRHYTKIFGNSKGYKLTVPYTQNTISQVHRIGQPSDTQTSGGMLNSVDKRTGECKGVRNRIRKVA